MDIYALFNILCEHVSCVSELEENGSHFFLFYKYALDIIFSSLIIYYSSSHPSLQGIPKYYMVAIETGDHNIKMNWSAPD